MKKFVLLILAGVFLVVFGFLIGFFGATNKFTRLLTAQKQEAAEEFEHSSFNDDSFYEGIFFGQNFVTVHKKQPLPEGKGILEGKFIYNNKPVPGIKFDITLNDSYIRKSVITDDKGSFTIKLPPGKWLINSINCKSWIDKPEGEFILLSGDEKLTGDRPWSDNYFQKAGKEIMVTNNVPQKERIVLTINPRIKVIWPEAIEKKQEATIAASKISWDPFPGAEKYMITIHRVTREGFNRSSYFPIIYMKTSGEALLPLNKLPHTKDPTAKEEYSISIQAFKESGELLSESRHFFGSFTLTDGHVLVETNMGDINLDQNKIEQIHLATKAINAVEILIGENMLGEAEILLTKFNDYEAQGKKELLMGYLSAAKGRCTDAQKYFDLAMKNGQSCIPDKYRLNCK